MVVVSANDPIFGIMFIFSLFATSGGSLKDVMTFPCAVLDWYVREGYDSLHTSLLISTAKVPLKSFPLNRLSRHFYSPSSLPSTQCQTTTPENSVKSSSKPYPLSVS